MNVSQVPIGQEGGQPERSTEVRHGWAPESIILDKGDAGVPVGTALCRKERRPRREHDEATRLTAVALRGCQCNAMSCNCIGLTHGGEQRPLPSSV